MAMPNAPTSRTTQPLVRWWRQPDHYDWLSSYLHARQFTKPARILMTALAGSFAFMPVVMNFAPAGTYGPFAMTVGWLAGFAGIGFAVIWGTRWPTQRQSVTIALLANGLLAASCLAQPKPLIGIVGCTALAVIAGYVALFHTAGYMVYNFALASSVGAVVATRLALSGEGVLAVGLYFVVIQLNVFVPFSIQAVVHALGIDLLQGLFC